MQFNTELLSAWYVEDRNIWRIETSTNETLTCHYLITALGLLSKQNWPAIPGRELFKGEVYHTGNWPRSYDFKGKRVGIIGNGSTGVSGVMTLQHPSNTKTFLSRFKSSLNSAKKMKLQN